MEDNIHLFDHYINRTLPPELTEKFEERLKSDRSFREDFRIYLFTLQGIIKEAEQDDLEFGVAMKSLSEEELMQAIRPYGFDPGIFDAVKLPEEELPAVCCDMNIAVNELSLPPFSGDDEEAEEDIWTGVSASKVETASKVERKGRRVPLLWLSSIAALFIIGIFSVIGVVRSGQNKVDDVIVYYNGWTSINRGGGDMPAIASLDGKELKSAISLYREIYSNPDESVQDRQQAGYSLAIAYLKQHDREAAKALLKEMIATFADDKPFANHCRELLNLLE